jgi:3',5'-cyclic-AMP phosphodiesterase
VTASILQLSDLHIGATWQPTDPLDTLRVVLGAVRALPQPPVAALITGDLTNGGSEHDYAQLAAVLGDELELSVHVLPGNHDDRAGLRRHFQVGGEATEPIQYAVEFDGLRVLMLDTTIPHEDPGDLDEERLRWVAAELAVEPQVPTILAMHHPPFLCGLPGMDRYALAAAARDALSRLVSEHPQVCGMIAGHVHLTLAAGVGGRPAVTIPSTYCQLQLDFTAERLEMVPGPIGFAIHRFVEGRLVSHVHTVAATA